MSFKDITTTILLLGQDSIPASVLLRASGITLDPLQAAPPPPPHAGSELSVKFKA
jgi:hypothetical protein